MRLGQRFRVFMLLMTLLVMVSPMASAQSTPQALPAEETPVVIETPTDEPIATEVVVDETTPAPTEIVDVTTPEATETEAPTDPVDVTDDLAPEASPTNEQRPVSAARDVELLATRTLVITINTSDVGGTVPAGIGVCVWNSYEFCQDWLGEPLTFTLNRSTSDYTVYVPGGSAYAMTDGTISVPSGQTIDHTVTLQKKATVEISLAPDTVPAGTEVCLDSSDESCQDWAGAPLSFQVRPGVVEYVVYVAPESGFAMAVGSFTVGAGETVQQTITLEAPSTVNVTVVTADGGPVPDWVQIYMHPSVEGWQDWEGDPLPFKVTPGEVGYEIDVSSSSAYSDVSGIITVATGETVELTVTLEPKDPATLRVYVTTADGASLPAGTEVCVNMPVPDFGEPFVDQCQTVTGPYVNFSIGQGEAEITVTPPAGSGYEGETGYFWTRLGETTRAVFELEGDATAFDAHVDVNVRAGDTSVENPLAGDSVNVCLFQGEFNLFAGCEYYGAATANEDGSLTFHLDVHGGTYNYYVATDTGVWVQGTLTAVSNETTEINVVLPLVDGQEKATLIVDVVMFDGSPVPEGTMVCAIDIATANENEADIEEFCRLWTGMAESFTLSPTLAIYVAIPEDVDGYAPTFQYVMLSPGETREVTITLYPYDLETTISHTVSEEAPQSGDTVTYTIRAYGQAPQFMTLAAYEPEIDFQIDNVLPVELTDVSVSCSGIYTPSIPGSCYELENGVLSVFGEYGMWGVFDITVTVTGTVVGEPGTVVSSTACVNQEFRGEDRVGANKIASTSLYGLALQQIPGDMPCATALLTIAQADEVPATPTPTDPATPEPTDPATPGVTPSPTAPATPGMTPSPASTATATATADPATPASDAVVTSLPSTGAPSGVDRSDVLLASMVAALSLMAAVCAVHLRSRNR